MERLRQPGKKGLGRQQLLLFGMLFLLAGMFSRSFLQNRVLQMGSLTGWQLLEMAGKKRGFLLARGEINTERMAKVLIDEFRSGKLGKFTLEMPEETA